VPTANGRSDVHVIRFRTRHHESGLASVSCAQDVGRGQRDVEGVAVTARCHVEERLIDGSKLEERAAHGSAAYVKNASEPPIVSPGTKIISKETR